MLFIGLKGNPFCFVKYDVRITGLGKDDLVMPSIYQTECSLCFS